MIIDDEESTTIAIRKHLQLAGFKNFHLVSNSNIAVDSIKELRPDIVLLDLMMPVNGFEILQTLRQSDELGNISVLALTGTEDELARSTLLILVQTTFCTSLSAQTNWLPVSETHWHRSLHLTRWLHAQPSYRPTFCWTH